MDVMQATLNGITITAIFNGAMSRSIKMHFEIYFIAELK